jgi:hypothetical protein
MHLVPDPDLECPVEDVEELVLPRMDMRRRAASRSGEVLEERERSPGALGSRLERHGVADDPDPLALACGSGVAGAFSGRSVGVHGAMVDAKTHHRYFIFLCE